MPKGKQKTRDEPNMSDKTLLLSVEDLINVAFGSRQDNKVDIKTIQTVLHILARQMRLLEQLVEIQIDDLEELEKQGALIPGSGPTNLTAGSLSKKASDKEKDRTSKGKDGGGGSKRETHGSKDQKGSRGNKAGTDKDTSPTHGDKILHKSKISSIDMDQTIQDSLGQEADKDFDRTGQGIGRGGGTSDENRRRGSYKSDAQGQSVTEVKPFSSKKRISISERQDGDDTVLVVDKERTGTSARTSRTGIEVITRPQFIQLEKAVKQLQTVTSVPEPLTLPDNEQLVEELLKGTASLSDTMVAMQIDARIQAAEQAVSRMAGILTRLAAMGTLPPELAKHLPDEKTLGIHGGDLPDVETKHVGLGGIVSIAPSSMLKPVPLGPDATITHEEMEVGFLGAREEIMKNMTDMVAKAIQNSDNALYVARSASDKIEVAVNLNKRVNSLYSMVADYSEQLSGFDEGISTQMQGFQEQMGQMRLDLKLGLEQLEAINTNAESAAIVELTERYEILMHDLESSTNKHQTLTVSQERLGDELKNLIVCLEILRDQKADRDEVWDALKDKASISRLTGLLTQAVFDRTRQDIDARLEQCQTKFQKQDQTWAQAIADITRDVEQKADLVLLLAEREHMQRELQKLLEKTQELEVRLGEPMAAVVTRQLNRGARCGSCMTAALMGPTDVAAQMPIQLPVFKHEKIEEVCLTTALPAERHACNRWVGGSHTLLSEAVTHERTTQNLAATAPPTKRYLGYGDDGRLYKMAEECLPCVECPRPKVAPTPEPAPTETKLIKPWMKPALGAQTAKIIQSTKRAKTELMKKLDAVREAKNAEQSEKLEASQPEHGGGDYGVGETIIEEKESQKAEIEQELPETVFCQPLEIGKQQLETEQQPLGSEQQPLGPEQQSLRPEQQPLGPEEQPVGPEQQPLETEQKQLDTKQQEIETEQQQGVTENLSLKTQIVGSKEHQTTLMEQPQPNQEGLQEGMAPTTEQPEEDEKLEVITL